MVRGCALLVLALGLAARTAWILPMFQNDLTLWSRAVSVDPSSAESWLNLGVARSNADDLDGAKVAYIRATTVKAQSPYPVLIDVIAGINLAVAHGLGEQWDLAQAALDRVPVPRPWPGAFETQAQHVEAVITSRTQSSPRSSSPPTPVSGPRARSTRTFTK